MEHYIFYCKLSLLAVLSLITACCMLSRRWYVSKHSINSPFHSKNVILLL